MQCDTFHTIQGTNGPRLERCPNPAVSRLTATTCGETYTTQRCQPCRDAFIATAPGAMTEILDEAPVILFDLLIASRKYGIGSTTNPDAPIVWWKVAGKQKEQPPRPVSLIHPLVQKRLADYELVATEVQVNQIIRKYRRVEVQNV